MDLNLLLALSVASIPSAFLLTLYVVDDELEGPVYSLNAFRWLMSFVPIANKVIACDKCTAFWGSVLFWVGSYLIIGAPLTWTLIIPILFTAGAVTFLFRYYWLSINISSTLTRVDLWLWENTESEMEGDALDGDPDEPPNIHDYTVSIPKLHPDTLSKIVDLPNGTAVTITNPEDDDDTRYTSGYAEVLTDDDGNVTGLKLSGEDEEETQEHESI